MTVLDTSVEHHPVLMVLGPHERVRPERVMLPEGYHLEPWDEHFRLPWVRLHVALGQLPSEGERLACFERTYGADADALRRQMVLACTERGALAGTSSLWTGTHFGEPRPRVHWVGVDPAHQRRGLARSLVRRTIALYDELVPSGEPPLYLTTQTESWTAIGMYLKLGFVAYRGPMPPNFPGCAGTFEQDNRHAWDLVGKKLAKA